MYKSMYKPWRSFIGGHKYSFTFAKNADPQVRTSIYVFMVSYSLFFEFYRRFHIFSFDEYICHSCSPHFQSRQTFWGNLAIKDGNFAQYLLLIWFSGDIWLCKHSVLTIKKSLRLEDLLQILLFLLLFFC